MSSEEFKMEVLAAIYDGKFRELQKEYPANALSGFLATLKTDGLLTTYSKTEGGRFTANLSPQGREYVKENRNSRD